jgi:predicted aspartyl protease
MSLTYVDARVTGPAGEADVEFLVHSEATYTSLPADVWQSLGVLPKRDIVIRLADGTELHRQVGECHVALPHGDTTTPVILGGNGDLALLGAVTLEELGLVLDPLNRTLHPMTVLIPSYTEGRGAEGPPT